MVDYLFFGEVDGALYLRRALNATVWESMDSDPQLLNTEFGIALWCSEADQGFPFERISVWFSHGPYSYVAVELINSDDIPADQREPLLEAIVRRIVDKVVRAEP